MAINFPNSPSTNDTFVSGDVQYRYDGTKWVVDTQAEVLEVFDVNNNKVFP